MATVAAGEVFRLLGAKDTGVKEDSRMPKMPAVNVPLLDGALAWRQHDGGHTDGPNWKYFIPWASKQLGYTALPDLVSLPNALRIPGAGAKFDKIQGMIQAELDLAFIGKQSVADSLAAAEPKVNEELARK